MNGRALAGKTPAIPILTKIHFFTWHHPGRRRCRCLSSLLSIKLLYKRPLLNINFSFRVITEPLELIIYSNAFTKYYPAFKSSSAATYQRDAWLDSFVLRRRNSWDSFLQHRRIPTNKKAILNSANNYLKIRLWFRDKQESVSVEGQWAESCPWKFCCWND